MFDRRIDRKDAHTYRGVCACCNKVVFGKRVSKGQTRSQIKTGGKIHSVPNSMITLHNPQVLEFKEQSFRNHLVRSRKVAIPDGHILNWIASQHGAMCQLESDRIVFGSVTYPIPQWMKRVRRIEGKSLSARELLKEMNLVRV